MKEHPREKEFQTYLATYRKSYGTQEEIKFRREVFAETMDFIEKFNSQSDNAYMKVN